MFKLACVVLLCTILIVQCQGNSRYIDLYLLRTFCCCLDTKPGQKPDEEGPASGEEYEEGSESNEEYGGPGKRPPPPHGGPGKRPPPPHGENGKGSLFERADDNNNDAGKPFFELGCFFNSNTVLFKTQYSFSN